MPSERLSPFVYLSMAVYREIAKTREPGRALGEIGLPDSSIAQLQKSARIAVGWRGLPGRGGLSASLLAKI